MNKKSRAIHVLLQCLFLVILSQVGLCESPSLNQGIEQYRQENYMEALRLLEQARKEDPKSSAAAFFLGLTYKQLMDHENAFRHFRDAVTLTPPIKEALVELIGVLYEMDKLEEAQKWIQVAEKDDIFPAKVTFLKGLVLRKEGKPKEAREAFERAKSLDGSLTQSADIQIALTHVEEKKFSQAKDYLQAALQRDPQSDLAGFARQYIDLVEKQIEAERPLRLTLAVHEQYDTNVVLKPTESALAPDITNEASRGTLTSLILNYVPRLDTPWLFNGQFYFSGNFHDRFSTSLDSISNGIYLAPGYNFGQSALNLAARYNHALVRSPSYKTYLGSLEIGPLYRHLLTENQILEIFGGFTNQDYYQPPLIPEEDRDSKGYHSYTSWIWLYRPEGFLNVRFEFGYNKTDGVNWENVFRAVSANITIPLIKKIQLQLGGQIYTQDFTNSHTVFQVKREDTNYTGQAGLTWEFYRNTNLVLQFSGYRTDSNIAIYDYDREVYSIGVEYRY